MVRDLDPTNDLSFLRVRTSKHEIMIAPGKGRCVGQSLSVRLQIYQLVLQLISAAFEHLCVWEIYAWDNVVLYIAVYGPYKP